MLGEKNPRRAVASTGRYEAVRAVADQVTMEVRWDGPRRRQRSYLTEILDLATGTGRRITAICSLRAEDLRLHPTSAAPHGAIRWPAGTDKMGRETIVPISPEVRSALLRILLRRAEGLAKLEPQEGSAFHAYRRGWATARKHLPLPDVAAAGSWKGTVALQRSYLQPDEQTMLTVVLSGAELRDVKRHEPEPILAHELAHGAFGSAKMRLSCCRITSGR